MSDPWTLAVSAAGAVGWLGMGLLSAISRAVKSEPPANGEYACMLVAMAFTLLAVAAAT